MLFLNLNMISCFKSEFLAYEIKYYDCKIEIHNSNKYLINRFLFMFILLLV